MKQGHMVGSNVRVTLDFGQSKRADLFFSVFGNSFAACHVINSSYRLFHWDTPRRVIYFLHDTLLIGAVFGAVFFLGL